MDYEALIETFVTELFAEQHNDHVAAYALAKMEEALEAIFNS